MQGYVERGEIPGIVTLVSRHGDTHGFGFSMSVVTPFGDYSGSVGTFGWDGGLGTAWYCNPREHMVSILMRQAM
jgi:CubicO group peptidase (beta-lactamase class C family)